MKFRTNIQRHDLALMQARLYWQWKEGLFALAVWAAIIGAVLVWMKGFPKSPQQGLTLFIASVAGACGSLVFIWLMSMAQIYFGSSRRVGVLGPHDFEIRDEGLFERTDANETLTKWPAVKSVLRRGSIIHVEVGPGLFHLIPRNAFQTDEAFESCYLELRRRAGSNA